MKAGSSKIKSACLIGLMLILFLPLIQKNLKVFDDWPLGGWTEPAANPWFSIKGWFSGDYQKNEEKHFNETFGFRNYLVRINNQLDYWFYKKANAKGVICGKNGILYEKVYTDAYFGLNYIGDQRIDSLLNQMKYLQKKLEKDNKLFIMVFAPGKTSYYPENIPEKNFVQKSKNNYKAFTYKINEYGINYIDFNKWFMEKRATTEYPLYPQLGIHWSTYGAALAFDSI